MNNPLDVLQSLAKEQAVKMEWDAPPRRGHGLRRWRLIIGPVNGLGPRVQIDTGLSTHRSGFLADEAGPAIVKATACLIAAMGPRVILPSGELMPDEWLRESMSVLRPQALMEIKRKPGRPRKVPLEAPEEWPSALRNPPLQ